MPEFWYPLSVNTLGEEEIAAATDVLRSGKTTMGEKVEEFEEAFARFVDAPYAVMVNSGSSANLLAALAVDTRGQVLVPAVTWPTQVWPWEQSGATVKFCDVDGVNTNMQLILQQCTDKTRAISIPHLMGIPVADFDFSLLPQPDCVIHEDCCEALGATYRGKSVGYLSSVATWSFFFSHQMSTMEGGMVTTPHLYLDSKLRSLRSHGWTRYRSPDKYTFEGPGFNLRPTELAAAIGLVQLRRVPEMNAQRAANHREFERYLRNHPNITLPSVPDNVEPSWFGVPMFVEQGRDDLAKYLEDHGIETRPILGGNLRKQPGFRGFYFPKTPGADRLDEQGLFVGLHPDPFGASEVAKLIARWG